MPSLSESSVHQFWHDYDKRVLYRIVSSMEGVEDWAADSDPEVQVLLDELGMLLDQNPDVEINHPESMVQLLSSIKLAKALRVMQFLDSLKPGSASKLLIAAEEMSKDDSHPLQANASFFLKRNLSFERLQLLARVFDPQRVNLILKSLENKYE